LTRFVIEGYREKCLTETVIGPRAKNPIKLDIPVYITSMSFETIVLMTFSSSVEEPLERGVQ